MAMHLPLNLLSATGVAEEDDDDPVAVVEDAPVLDEVSLSLPGGQSGGSPGSDSVCLCSLEQERKKKMMMLLVAGFKHRMSVDNI